MQSCHLLQQRVYMPASDAGLSDQKSQDAKAHLSVHLGQSEKQQHALFVIGGAFGCAGLKLLEQEVQLLLVEQLRQLRKHAENVDSHRLKSVRLHSKASCSVMKNTSNRWNSLQPEAVTAMHELDQVHDKDWRVGYRSSRGDDKMTTRIQPHKVYADAAET